MKKVLTAIMTAIFSICLVVATVSSAAAASKLKNMANVKATATPITVTLSWSKSSDAKGYEIQQKSGKKWKTVTTIKKQKTTSYTVKKLKNGTTYQFRIRSYNGKKYSNYKTVKIKTGVEAIKSFAGTSTGLTSVKLTWAKANVNGYVVQRKVGSKWKDIKKIKKASTTYVNISGLPAGQTSSFRIRGYVNGAAKTYYGSYTKEIKVTTAVLPMKSVAVKSVADTYATVGWAKLSGVSGYQIQKLQGGKWVNVNTAVKNSVTSYKVTGLTACAQNQVRVRAYQKSGSKTYYNAWAVVKPVTKIGTVTGFAGPSYTNDTTAKLTWKAAPGAKTYRVYNNNVKLFDVATTYANIKVDYNKTYKISVAPVNGKTVGAKTAVITFTTPCAQVKNVAVTSITDTSVSLSWSAVSGAQSYRVEYSADGKTWKSISSTKTAATVEYLEKDTEYQFRVSAANKNASKVQYGKAGLITQATPAGITTTTSAGMPKLSWDAVEGVVTYKVERYLVNKNQEEWTSDADVSAPETEFTCTYEKTSYYRVSGIDAEGKVIYTSEGITVSGVGRTFTKNAYGVTFSWPADAVSNATSYQIVLSAQKQAIETKTVGSTVTSYTFTLAPATFYEVEVHAIVSGKKIVVDQFAFVTEKLNVADNSDKGINAKLLYLAESINRTKFDNSVVTEMTVHSESVNKMTYMEFDAGELNGLMVIPLSGAFKGLKSGKDYDIGLDGIKCYNEQAVSALLNFIDESSGDSNNIIEINDVKAVYNDPDSGYTNGLGDIKITDGNGKVTEKKGHLYDGIQPVGKRAYIYNSANPSAWKNGFESVTVKEVADGYEMTVVIKAETADPKNNKKTEYHAGLVNSIGNTNISFGGDEEDTTVTTKVGKTTITAKIDRSGRLVTYNVISGYKMDMDSSMTVSLTGEESGSLKFDMAMDLEGSEVYTTTFKRYSK